MAYLRGNTFVDGELNVQGALVVNAVTSSTGNVPYYSSNGKEVGTMPIVQNVDGRISTSYIKVTFDDSADSAPGIVLAYVRPDKKANRFLINNSGALVLNKETGEWEFRDN